MDPSGLGPKTKKLLKLLKSMKINVFVQPGKDAHRDSAKVALNDSSRSLIWNFLEQIVFLEICGKVSKILKYDHLLFQMQYIGAKIIAASRRQIIAVARRKIIAVSGRKINAVSRQKINAKPARPRTLDP